MEGLLDPVALIDVQGRILACNQPWQDRLPRRNLLRVLASAPSRMAFGNLLKEVLEGSRDQCCLEFAWTKKLWLRGKARRLPDPNPLSQAMVFFEDISERIAHQEEGNVYERLLNLLRDPIFVLDPLSGETVYCNAAIWRHMELEPQEEPQTSNYGPLFELGRLQNLVHRLTVAGPLVVESMHRTARGRRIPVELSLKLLPSRSNGRLIVGVVRDISQRKLDFAEMQSAGARLQAILQSAPVAITTLTLEGFVASWNRGAENIYGWSAAEVLLQPPPFASDSYLQEALVQVHDQLVTRTLLIQRRCKDGSLIKLNLSICPLLNDKGQISGLLEVAEDITDRAHADLLETSRRLLESREAERLRLAREIHDGALQDLIAISFALAQLGKQLRAKNALPADAELLRVQQAEVLRVARQLRALVSELRPAGLEEFGLVPSVEGLVAKLTREHPDTLEVQLDLQEIPELSLPQQLCVYRAVQESLQNCLKHAHAAKLVVTLRRLDSEAVLLIRDDGCGFEVPESLRTLTSSEHYGLAGMDERAELTGAILAVHSECGVGTEVRLTMPILE